MKKVLIMILLGCFFFGINSNAQEGAPLTLFQIEKVLKSKEVTLKERNRLLIEGVKERGITFPVYRSVIKSLVELGASPALLDVLQSKSPEFPTLIQGKMKTDGLPFQFRNSIDIEFRVIPRGDFMMGAKPTEVGSLQNEKPQHKVIIGKSIFYQPIRNYSSPVEGNNGNYTESKQNLWR